MGCFWEPQLFFSWRLLQHVCQLFKEGSRLCCTLRPLGQPKADS